MLLHLIKMLPLKTDSTYLKKIMKLGLNLIPLYFTVRAVQTVYSTVISWREVLMLWCENPALLT